MSTINATWTACGDPIGSPFKFVYDQSTNIGTWKLDNVTTGDSNWIYHPEDPNPPPFTYPAPPSFPSFPPDSLEDEKGKKVVRAPLPSLELVLVEIAKILREGGDILEVRAIFERYKLKLLDHDGEIIFDPKDVERLEEKGF